MTTYRDMLMWNHAWMTSYFYEMKYSRKLKHHMMGGAQVFCSVPPRQLPRRHHTQRVKQKMSTQRLLILGKITGRGGGGGAANENYREFIKAGVGTFIAVSRKLSVFVGRIYNPCITVVAGMYVFTQDSSAQTPPGPIDCIVLMGWSLLLNALRPFQDLLCSLEFRYY